MGATRRQMCNAASFGEAVRRNIPEAAGRLAMVEVSRRSFLEKCGFGALAAALTPMWSKSAAAAWADIPPGVWAAGYQPKKILEIYCYGGMSQWENFWVSEDMAAVK